MEIIFTKSAEQTQKLGEKFAQDLKSGGIICLYGDLGSGKTTFVQGLARGLGIKQRILSPTFLIVREYPNFYHLDLYRLQKSEEIADLGFREMIENPQNVVVIEWAEKAKNLLPKERIEINFEIVNENERKITISR
ncbi:MAG: tRNA (adenosine(37)-N6)-threonylcarbamoyltransferase complex ATPase subunit type 1 TsaE [Patescibacteria group bacterium]|nr:tRNA (adenosine(37)-N6)-threonylcarbamoyltransferase complex ATPase subunit type 1 TsaE [Patescibacteria group bacterium]